MNTMLTMVYVHDMSLSVRFYRDTLGLRMRFESPDWSEFDVGGNTLALHGGASRAEPRQGPARAGSAQIGFSVTDLDTTFRELQSRGVTFVMPPQDRKGEGIRLAVILDPDGLPISLSQSLR